MPDMVAEAKSVADRHSTVSMKVSCVPDAYVRVGVQRL